MNPRNVISLSTLAALGLTSAAMLVMLPSGAYAVTAKQLVGTWRLVSTTNTNAQGAKVEPFGPHPLGSYTFDASGHFTQAIVASEGGGKGIVAAFGGYSVTNGGKTLVRQIVGSQNPSTDGKDLPLAITLANNELKVTNPNPTIGTAHVESIWKRVK